MSEDITISAYQDCINKIDDYFEYMNESEKDKSVVMSFVDELTKELAEIPQPPST